jgi:transcriptional regulator with XRE-family HTH domain
MPHKKPPYADFAKRLFVALKRYELDTGKSLSQEEIAAAVGMSDSTVSNWFNGVSLPRHDQFKKMGKLLNAHPGYLAFGDETEITSPGTREQKGGSSR